VEVVASLSQGRTAAAQCDLFTHKSVPVIFEPPYIYIYINKLQAETCRCKDLRKKINQVVLHYFYHFIN